MTGLAVPFIIVAMFGNTEALGRIEGKLDQVIENQARTDQRLESHAGQVGGRAVHHAPPCDALVSFSESLNTRLKLTIAGLAALAGVATALYSFFS